MAFTLYSVSTYGAHVGQDVFDRWFPQLAKMLFRHTNSGVMAAILEGLFEGGELRRHIHLTEIPELP